MDRFQSKSKNPYLYMSRKIKFNLTSVEKAHSAIRHKAAHTLRAWAQQMSEHYLPRPFFIGEIRKVFYLEIEYMLIL